MVGLYAGLRREEILGLHWDSVEMKGKAPHIKVWHTLRWQNNQPKVDETLKSDAASREIPIPPQLVTWLKAEQAQSSSDFVVHNKDCAPCSKTTYKNYWGFVMRLSTGPATRMVPQPDGMTKPETV